MRDVRHGGGINHRRGVRLWRTGQTQCRAKGATYQNGGDINHRRNVRLWRTGQTQCRAIGATYRAVISTTDVTCALAHGPNPSSRTMRDYVQDFEMRDVVFGLK